MEELDLRGQCCKFILLKHNCYISCLLSEVLLTSVEMAKLKKNG